MKALILAAGYATRLYPLTKDKAKPLLPVGGKPIINYIIDHLEGIDEIDTIYVVTNEKFSRDFEEWGRNLSSSKEIITINDGTTADGTKLGAIGDIDFVIRTGQIDDDLLVVGGDNLFDFDMRRFVDFFEAHGNTVALHSLDDREALKRYNEICLDENGRIISFREKPEDPQTDHFAICLYLYNREGVSLVKKYLDEGNNPDAPGYYVQWLYKQTDVYGVPLSGTWYDIGDLEVYNAADRDYSARS